MQVRQARQPAVGAPADQIEHARLVAADPDAHVVRGGRTALCSRDPILLAADPDAAALTGCPYLADDADRFLERTDCLAGRQPPAAIRLDRVPECARADAKLDPPAAEQI